MDDNIRRMALAAIGFQSHAEMWHRGRVVFPDAESDAMEARTWAQRLKRWTRRQPRARR